MANRQSFWDLMAARTQKEIAEHLGVDQGTVSKMKSNGRGMSPEVARRVAAKTGENAPKLYLLSQLASIERAAATKSMSEAGFMGSAQHVMRNCTKQFRPDEMRAAQKDEEFLTAAKRLRELLLKALDLVGPEGTPEAVTATDAGVVYHTGDSVAPALKSTRDAHGIAATSSGKVERDLHGRRIKD